MGDWLLDAVDGLTVVRCAGLLGIAGLRHAFSTRQADDGACFDLGLPGSDDSLIEERRRRFCAAAGLGGRSPIILSQQHGSEIVRTPLAAGRRPPEADGILILNGEEALQVAAVRTADCVPILLADRRGRAAAALHAGWRGTAAGIASRAIELFAGLGIEAAELLAALGPSICPRCYEVGPEVLRAVGQDGGSCLDLAGANVGQLRSAGMRVEAIFRSPWCTSCRTDLFFSHRREGRAAGRLMACIGWEEKSAP